jgi:hypothetical protein
VGSCNIWCAGTLFWVIGGSSAAAVWAMLALSRIVVTTRSLAVVSSHVPHAQEASPQHSVSLDTLSAVYFGKQTQAFKSNKHALSVADDHCFSLAFEVSIVCVCVSVRAWTLNRV